MRPKALIVDDDPDIREAVSEILDSLHHTYEVADSLATAREQLESGNYNYILLDLEIPVRAGRSLSRIQNGENLLEEIVQRRGSNSSPIVIVMTAHGTDGPDLAVDMMKKGACDYVTKPFQTSGRTLDKSIRAALTLVAGTAAKQEMEASVPGEDADSQSVTSGNANLVPFTGGTMKFFDDRVELCGATICSGSRRRREALHLLRLKDKKGEFIAYSGEELAKKISLAGPDSAASLIRDLRKEIRTALQSVGMECQAEDVILSRGIGYRLSQKLSVEQNGLFKVTAEQGHTSVSPQPNDPDREPDDDPDSDPDDGTDEPVRDTDREPVNDLDDTANELDDTRRATAGSPPVPDVHSVEDRQNWIVEQLRIGRKLRIAHIVEDLKCSESTAKRALNSLKDENIIEWVGSTKAGNYRLKVTSQAATSDL